MIDLTGDEEHLLESLYPLSRNLQNAKSRNAAKIKGIIISGRSVIRRYRKLLKENRKRIASLPPEEKAKFSRYIDQRFLLLSRASNLPLFRRKTLRDLHMGKLPSFEDVLSGTPQIEIIFGNLYMSASIYNSLNAGAEAEELMKELESIIPIYERTRQIHGSKGHYRSDPPGRAEFAYALELLAETPNVLQRAQQQKDNSILYGKDGIHLQIKGTHLLSPNGRKTFERVYMQAVKDGEPLCFPDPLREIFLKSIPPYNFQNSHSPPKAVYG